jgi:hypothetical protein
MEYRASALSVYFSFSDTIIVGIDTEELRRKQKKRVIF